MKKGVVGAGLMGAEIGLVHALAGADVILSDRNMDVLTAAKARLAGILEKGVKRGFYEESQVAPTLERISLTVELDAFVDCDMVTEAVFESEDVKADVLKSLDGICKSGCIIATNTSTIPISTLASYLREERRRDFVGTHYFSPVSRMKLVEVIAGFDTSPEVLDKIMKYCEVAGKTPIRVKDVAGFAVNRMLHAFVIEAVKLVEEGVASPEDLDVACKLGLGHAIGPFELMDVVTADLCVQAQEIMQEAYGERFRPPALLKQRVRAGYGGGKGRKGWYKK